MTCVLPALNGARLLFAPSPVLLKSQHLRTGQPVYYAINRQISSDGTAWKMYF